MWPPSLHQHSLQDFCSSRGNKYLWKVGNLWSYKEGKSIKVALTQGSSQASADHYTLMKL